jgi:hypothetical protein
MENKSIVSVVSSTLCCTSQMNSHDSCLDSGSCDFFEESSQSVRNREQDDLLDYLDMDQDERVDLLQSGNLDYPQKTEEVAQDVLGVRDYAEWSTEFSSERYFSAENEFDDQVLYHQIDNHNDRKRLKGMSSGMEFFYTED